MGQIKSEYHEGGKKLDYNWILKSILRFGELYNQTPTLVGLPLASNFGQSNLIIFFPF